MMRYAWAYQSGGEFRAYPIQSITMSLERQIPSIRLTDKTLMARIAVQMLIADTRSGQLYIFSTR